MRRTLACLASIAIPAALATALSAQQAAEQQSYITAEEIEEASIVTLETQYDSEVWENRQPLDAMLADLSRIGGVEAVVLEPSGQIAGLATDVGGFLGIGAKRVLLPLDDIRLASDAEGDGLTVVTRLSRDELENLSEFSLDD